jgi:hypothetical protein
MFHACFPRRGWKTSKRVLVFHPAQIPVREDVLHEKEYLQRQRSSLAELSKRDVVSDQLFQVSGLATIILAKGKKRKA